MNKSAKKVSFLAPCSNALLRWDYLLLPEFHLLLLLRGSVIDPACTADNPTFAT